MKIRCLKVLVSLSELWNDSGTFKKQEDLGDYRP